MAWEAAGGEEAAGSEAEGEEAAALEGRGAADVALEIAEERIRRLLDENAGLCKELSSVNGQLERSRRTEAELSSAWKAAIVLSARQKITSQGLAKTVQQASRAAEQHLTEVAQQIRELQDVQSKLHGVGRQLSMAVELQTQALADFENRFVARGHRVRKLELALYRVVAQAQAEPGLEAAVAALIAQSGTLVRGVLAREAQRQALELAGKDQ
mmetsp:Transcript_56110/g.180075  ORF Transcript_56110/g.180075 Transcript_56110/m.180075 type:complete len:213 (+) Transcript_56110:63-701(+)